MNIVIVGGGHAALTLLGCFSAMTESRVIGVADLRPEAPGMVRARELGIHTTTDMEALVTRADVHLVIDVTGVARVRAAISALLRPEQEVMSAAAAKVMYDVIELRQRQNQAASAHLSKEFRGFGTRLSGARESIDKSLEQVDKVLSAMKIVALNAKIEASRAGAAGRAFGVVAEEMKRMTANAQTALETIRRASTDTHETLGELDRAEREMLSMFS
jgi:methyl-accepting chemotaxis protein